jgi:hypothetical protein
MADLDRQRLCQAELEALAFDTFAETAFDDLIHAAAQILEVPMATVTIVHDGWRWVQSEIGLTHGRAPVAEAFCDYALRTSDAFFVVEDATNDLRFANHPLVTGEASIRFYECVLLRRPRPTALGS